MPGDCEMIQFGLLRRLVGICPCMSILHRPVFLLNDREIKRNSVENFNDTKSCIWFVDVFLYRMDIVLLYFCHTPHMWYCRSFFPIGESYRYVSFLFHLYDQNIKVHLYLNSLLKEINFKECITSKYFVKKCILSLNKNSVLHYMGLLKTNW